jgi:membrane protease YdiL (CAAX protease family)
MASIRRSASSADSICAAALLMLSVWGLLAGVPILMEPFAGADLALLAAFLSAAILVRAASAPARATGTGRAGGPLRTAALGALGVFAGFAGALAAFAAFTAFGVEVGWPPGAAAPAPGSPAFWAAAVLVAPLFEELLYRERLLLAFRAAIGGIPAVVLTSLLFAMPHLDPPLVLVAFAAGLTLGAVRLASGSIALCIGIHAGLNAASIGCGLRALRCAGIAFASVTVATAAAAAEVRWSGTLSIDFLDPSLPRIAIPGTGVATLNGSGGGFPLTSLHLAGGITGSAVVPVSDPDVTASINSVRGTATLGTGVLRPFAPSAPPSETQLTRATLPVRGAARLCFIVSRCGSALTLPFTAAGGQVGLGVGGSWTVGGFGAFRVSIEGAPWTPRTASVIATTESGETVGIPAAGWGHGPFSLATSAGLTSGAISLVTPMRVASSDGRRMSGFGRLTLRFVPEPGRLVLLSAGVAGLVCAGRNRTPPRQRPARR